MSDTSCKHLNDYLPPSHPHFRWRGVNTLTAKQLPDGYMDALAEAAQKKLGPPNKRTGARPTIPLTDEERAVIAAKFGL